MQAAWLLVFPLPKSRFYFLLLLASLAAILVTALFRLIATEVFRNCERCEWHSIFSFTIGGRTPG